MKGKTSVLVGVAVLLVAGALVWVKVAGSDDGTTGEGTEEITARKTRKAGGGSAGTATKKTRRPTKTGRTQGGAGTGKPLGVTSTLSGTEAARRSRPWIADVLQTKDPAKREAALAAMKEALIGEDEMAAYAALKACMGMKSAEFDRSWFRDLVEPYLEAGDPGMRRSAWYAFVNTEQRPEDVARVRELVRDPAEEVRRSVGHLLFIYEKGDLTGGSGSAVLGMLNVEENAVRREILRGTLGASMSPGLEAKVIALSRSNDPAELNDAVTSLSMQANKSPVAVQRLVEIISDSTNPSAGGRASRGLLKGVSEEAQPRIAEAALGMLEPGGDRKTWSYGMSLLGRYGTEDHRQAIETLAADPSLDTSSRRSLQMLLQKMK